MSPSTPSRTTLRWSALAMVAALLIPAASAAVLWMPNLNERPQDTYNRETANAVVSAMQNALQTPVQNALDAATVALDQRAEATGGELALALQPLLGYAKDNVNTTRALLDVLDDAHADSLAKAVAAARVGTARQALALNTTLLTPLTEVAHASPSAAARAILALDGTTPDAEQDAAIAALDTIPEPARGALTAMLDAYVVFAEEATAAARSPGADTTGRVLSARVDLLDAAAALRDALDATSAFSTPIVDAPPSLLLEFARDADTYASDYRLLLDAGGDDTYRNNAGGSGVRLPEASGTDRCLLEDQPSRVLAPDHAALVDLAGADDYAGGTGCGVNGGGYLGSGFLLDAAGDDAYAGGIKGVNGGGYGAGIGFLVDAEGADAYAGRSNGVNGGTYNGAGFLLDAAGDDAYAAEDHGTNGGAFVYLGTNQQVSAFLVDASGQDVYEAYTRAANGGAMAFRKDAFNQPYAHGFLLDAAGDDTYNATELGVNGGGWGPQHSVHGLLGGGVGHLFDAGGDDTYHARGKGANGGALDLAVGMLADAGGNDRFALAPSYELAAETTARTLADAPLATVEPQTYLVGVEAVPAGLAPGDTFLGATVRAINPVLRFVAVDTLAPLALVLAALDDPNVRYVEADPVGEPLGVTPNDPRWPEQYGPARVRADEAWTTSLGAPSHNVCVIDTGVRRTHEDIAPNWVGGYDAVDNDTEPQDSNGHGTHVAGTAAGRIGNGLGIAGVANVGILGVRGLGGTGSAIATGVQWCADNGGDVISMSLRMPESQAMHDALVHAWEAGSLIVAAAGNNGPCIDCVTYPAKHPLVVAVPCTDADDALCGFSSTGPQVEVGAPGLDILAPVASADDAYELLSGTSMSAPHVSGAATLVWTQVPELTNCQLRRILRDTAVDLGSTGWDDEFGYGRLDVRAALDAALGGSRPTSCAHDIPPGGWRGMNGGGIDGGAGFLLDVAGDDLYDAPGLYAVNGGGWNGGAGLLADGGGRDEYRGRGKGANGGGPMPGFAVALGLLADGGGRDTYREGDVLRNDATVFPKGDYGAQFDSGL